MTPLNEIKPFVLSPGGSMSKYRLLASSFDRLRTNGEGVVLHSNVIAL
jgi:hypothetical protein